MTWILLVLFVVWLGRFVVGLLNLARIRAPRQPEPAFLNADLPLVSVCIPARNEAEALEETLPRFLGQDYPNYEVIVVDDQSEDGTAAILENYRGDPRLRIIQGSDPPEGWLGKCHALNQAQAAARGNWLCFSDADALYEPNTLSCAMNEALLEKAGLVAMAFRIRMESWAERLLMPYLGFTFCFTVPAYLVNRDKAKFLASSAGAFALMSREAYEAAGGHAAVRDQAVDDVVLGNKIARRGFRVRFYRGEGLISIRMYKGFWAIWDGFLKNYGSPFARRPFSAALFLGARLFVNIGPYAALALLPFCFTPPRAALAAATLAVIHTCCWLVCRGMGVWSFVILRPLASIIFSFIFVHSVWLHWRGKAQWRGRIMRKAARPADLESGFPAGG